MAQLDFDEMFKGQTFGPTNGFQPRDFQVTGLIDFVAFSETPRLLKGSRRVAWIFNGGTGSGKTKLAGLIASHVLNTSAPRERDYSREAPTGTSVSYVLRRLKREREDLYDRVNEGEITANEAMIEAGFRERQLTIPLDPRKAARRIVRHFTREQFSQFVDEALDYYKGR